MSQNNQNNDLSGIWIAMGLAGAFIMVAFLLVYALLLFVTFILTIIAIFAWFKPVTLGRHTLEPAEARAFVVRGLIGAFLLPAFVVFCELVFGIRVNGDYLPHFILGGYVLGSLGVAMLEESNAADAATAQTIDHIPAPPPVSQIAPPKGFVPSAKPGFMPPGYGPTPPQTQPFRFASWDDEEERS